MTLMLEKIWSGALSYKSASKNKAELEVGISLGQKFFDHPKRWSFVAVEKEDLLFLNGSIFSKIKTYNLREHQTECGSY